MSSRFFLSSERALWSTFTSSSWSKGLVMKSWAPFFIDVTAASMFP